MKGPTERQKEIAFFIASFISENGRSPSYCEIGDHFSISPQAVHYAVSAMEKKGMLEKKERRARALTLSREMRATMCSSPIPFFPQEPDEREIEEGSSDTIFAVSPEKAPLSFAFTVTSWSMKEGGILPGDIAIMLKTGEAKDGDIVLAHPEGSVGRMELRRLRKLGKNYELWPENDSMGITRSQNMTICGILMEIRRKY